MSVHITGVRVDGQGAVVLTIQDLTAWEHSQAELRHLATHDELTGLPNRALISTRLARALARSASEGGAVAVLYLDCDGFKFVNDAHGHDVGDALLVAIGSRLRAAVRPGDTVARLAGDEFLVVAERVTSESQAGALAERLVACVRDEVSVGPLRLRVSASVGVAMGGVDADAGELMAAADQAMYAAKSIGPGNIQFFDEGLRVRTRRTLELEADLPGAIERGELECHYQPIVELVGERVVGMEALLRWHRPAGEVTPGEFIPVAEASGAIVPIGAWVLEQGCLAESRWREHDGPRAGFVSVNVSPLQLTASDFVAVVADTVGRTGARPDRLVLEITESALIESMAAVAKTLTRLRDMGLGVAVDDFGTGYSSLRELAHLPASILKVDGYFVGESTREAKVAGLVEAMVSISDRLGLTVIGERVETREEADLLRSMGCQWAQGYLFGRPAPLL